MIGNKNQKMEIRSDMDDHNGDLDSADDVRKLTANDSRGKKMKDDIKRRRYGDMYPGIWIHAMESVFFY